jgi:hypothetical protein
MVAEQVRWRNQTISLKTPFRRVNKCYRDFATTMSYGGLRQSYNGSFLKDAMNKILFVVVLAATPGIFAAAQDGRIFPPLTARENPQVVSTEPATERVVTTSSKSLPFCPPKTCLYYAGDFNSADSNANGLFNANDTGDGLEGWTWIGVKPPKNVTVTGVTFNQLFIPGFSGTNPTPFQTQIGITEGSAGKLVCSTTGNATMAAYGESDFGYVQYSYTVKKLKQACKIAKPSKQYPSTYVNLLPTSSNGYSYVVNVEDAKPKNHRGWKNDLNDCYFFATGFSVRLPPGPWVTCNSQGMGTNGFSELSIALTGKESK